MVYFPCELVVWHVLPALRRELCTYLIKEKGMKTKDVAKLFNLTNAAVSQYIHKKRAKTFVFDKKFIPEIEALAEHIVKTDPKERMVEYIKGGCEICRKIKGSGMLCNLHRKDEECFNNCETCLGKAK